MAATAFSKCDNLKPSLERVWRMAGREGIDACFRLAAACCRFPADTERDRAVIAAARGVTDWPLFLGVLRRHRIEALAHAALTAAQVPLPADTAANLRQRAQAIAHRNLGMAAETARLQNLLDAAGIPVLMLKGAALGQLAYRSIAIKFSQDIDLLVGPEGRDAALDVLTRDGYRLERPVVQLDTRRRDLIAAYGREVSLGRADSGHQVELRWQTVGSPSLLAGIDARAPFQTVTLSGALTLRTLRDDDLFAYLCVHGTGHGWSRLQWLADLNAFVTAQDEAGLMRLYRHAQGLGAGFCAMVALALCRDLFGRPLPAAIAQDIETSSRARRAAALARGIMAGPDVAAQRFGTTRIAVIQFLIGGGPRHYARLLRNLCFRLDDMLAVPLPRGLRFLYPLARLPLWLWRKFARSA